MKALELADKLDAQATWVPSDPAGVMYKSATELRRLAEVNAELVKALEKARQELDGLPRSLGYDFTHIPVIDAALAKAKEQQ